MKTQQTMTDFTLPELNDIINNLKPKKCPRFYQINDQLVKVIFEMNS